MNDGCNTIIYQYLKIFRKGILPIFWILVPVVLITIGLIKLIKCRKINNEENKKRKKKEATKSFVTAIIFFIIFTAFLLIWDFIATAYEKKKSNGYRSCWEKPIIYIYPKEPIDLKITLKNSKEIQYSYPKYEKNWDIHVTEDGNIYDKKTKRNYYALYWEGQDDTKETFDEGFVIEGKNTAKFLEEKLELLGLNEKEINEFIIYWLPKMENNKYNLIRFRTLEEINEYMPLEFNEKPDTLIRIFMNYKAINKKLKIKTQELQKIERKGYTIVEWGGRKIN